MFNFFSSVVDFFATIWSFLSNFLSGIITAFQVVYASLNLPQILRGFVPGFLSACILIVVSIGIIKLILGWGNS